MSTTEPITLSTVTKAGRELLHTNDHAVAAHGEFLRWDEYVATWLDLQWPSSGLSAKWSALPGSTLVIGGHFYDDDEYWSAFHNAVRERLAFLARVGDSIQSGQHPKRLSNTTPASDQVFIVHGHDESLRESVARFLEKLGLKAIILHEQPNRGRTIIEKFEEHALTAFAVVLLTPDDVGGKDKDTLRPRARQNVILELGFFCGAITRGRICAIHKGDVELPSDFSGIVYVPYDEAWSVSLARELKAAGLPVDMNKCL
jgi:predicted nucleotide-binding protein